MKKISLLISCFIILSCKSIYNNSNLNNIDNLDQNAIFPTQGEIGVCVSFGLIGMLENNFYNKTGISVDLSETYFLRNALIENGELYNVKNKFLS